MLTPMSVCMCVYHMHVCVVESARVYMQTSANECVCVCVHIVFSCVYVCVCT